MPSNCWADQFPRGIRSCLVIPRIRRVFSCCWRQDRAPLGTTVSYASRIVVRHDSFLFQLTKTFEKNSSELSKMKLQYRLKILFKIRQTNCCFTRIRLSSLLIFISCKKKKKLHVLFISDTKNTEDFEDKDYFLDDSLWIHDHFESMESNCHTFMLLRFFSIFLRLPFRVKITIQQHKYIYIYIYIYNAVL